MPWPCPKPAGRMHQLRRHMALLGHPVLGDSKYTYGYAMRHPDAAVQLKAGEAEQAMSPPFGVSSEHPSVQRGCDDKYVYSAHTFGCIEYRTLCITPVLNLLTLSSLIVNVALCWWSHCGRSYLVLLLIMCCILEH